MLRILLKKGTNLIVFMINTNVDCRSFMLTRNIWCWTPDSKVKVSTSIYGGIGTPLYFLRVSSRVFAPLTVSANGCSMKTNLHQFPRRLRWGLRCRPNSLQKHVLFQKESKDYHRENSYFPRLFSGFGHTWSQAHLSKSGANCWKVYPYIDSLLHRGS